MTDLVSSHLVEAVPKVRVNFFLPALIVLTDNMSESSQFRYVVKALERMGHNQMARVVSSFTAAQRSCRIE